MCKAEWCSACSRRIEWELACVSQKGGRWLRREEDRRGCLLHVQKRVLAHLASCHLGLPPTRGGFESFPSRFTAAPLQTDAEKTVAFFPFDRLVSSVNTLKGNRSFRLPVTVYFLKCWHSLIFLCLPTTFPFDFREKIVLDSRERICTPWLNNRSKFTSYKILNCEQSLDIFCIHCRNKWFLFVNRNNINKLKSGSIKY